ncbi:ANTAR domain-containing protein [Nocardia sp. NPDC003482]
MRKERADALARLGATSVAVAGLRDIVTGEQSAEAALARVAGAAAEAAPQADLVSISVLAQRVWHTATHTAAAALPLDAEQFSADRGPALESVRARRPVRARTGGEARRWPEFDAAAARAGVRAALSVPLWLEIGDGDPLPGALTCYSYTDDAFDPFDEGLLNLYALVAGHAVADARRRRLARDAAERFQRAVASRAEIEQAKGALMALHGCSADEAFARLVEQSQRNNIRVHVLARRFLGSLGGSGDRG